MIEVYHWEPNAAGARVLIALEEKGLEFESRFVDVLAFEQHSPGFLALNPSGETPVLVHDGKPFSEASFICEYLEEAFAGPALLPAAPLDRWAARAWQKYVDDYLAATVSDLAWAALGRDALEGRDADEIDAAVARIPMQARRDHWRRAIDGLDEDVLNKARERVRLTLEKTEAGLTDRDWLVPGGFSLADIAVYAYLAYLPRIAAELLGERTAAWLQRMAARPAVRSVETLSRAGDPYSISAPGPEPIRWG